MKTEFNQEAFNKAQELSASFARKCRDNGVELFQDKSGYTLSQAQRNLEGRTHYCDDITLKYFGARINKCSILDSGLLLGLIESLSHPSLGRIHRPVFFDVFGNTHGRPDIENSFKTGKAAEKQFWVIANSLDVVAITREALEREKRKHERQLQDINNCLGE